MAFSVFSSKTIMLKRFSEKEIFINTDNNSALGFPRSHLSFENYRYFLLYVFKSHVNFKLTDKLKKINTYRSLFLPPEQICTALLSAKAEFFKIPLLKYVNTCQQTTQWSMQSRSIFGTDTISVSQANRKTRFKGQDFFVKERRLLQPKTLLK